MDKRMNAWTNIWPFYNDLGKDD